MRDLHPVSSCPCRAYPGASADNGLDSLALFSGGVYVVLNERCAVSPLRLSFTVRRQDNSAATQLLAQMDFNAHNKRQMQLLGVLAEKARGRTDVKLALSDIAPELDIEAYVGGTKVVDRDNPQYDGGSDHAYDFNVLHEQQLIAMTSLRYERRSPGIQIPKDPGIAVTAEGFEAVRESKRSWLSRSIEKQPITFLQIVVTFVFSAVSAVAAFSSGVIRPTTHRQFRVRFRFRPHPINTRSSSQYPRPPLRPANQFSRQSPKVAPTKSQPTQKKATQQTRQVML